MDGESIVLLLLAGAGAGWSVAAIGGGYKLFHAMRGEFSRTLLPLFVLSALSFMALSAVALFPRLGMLQTIFFICAMAMVAWLFRDYTRSIARLLPAFAVPVLLAWTGLAAVALALYFCVFALLFMFSSKSTTDAGSPVVLGADMLLIVAFFFCLYYAMYGHFLWFFIGAVFYSVGTWLLLMPAVAVEVVRRHASQPE